MYIYWTGNIVIGLVRMKQICLWMTIYIYIYIVIIYIYIYIYIYMVTHR